MTMTPSGATGRVRFRTRLPTAVPGVNLRLSGRLRYRSDTPVASDGRSTLRVAAVHSVYLLAEAMSRSCLPGQDHGVGGRIRLSLGQWQRSPLTAYPGLEVRARAKVTLPRADRKRMDEYQAARRLHHRELVSRSDELDHFTGRVLHDTASARYWWVQNHGGSEKASHMFDELFLPLVGDGDGDRDRTLLIASTIAEAIRRVEHEPGEYEKLVYTVESVLSLWNRWASADVTGSRDPGTRNGDGTGTDRDKSPAGT